MAFKSPPVKLRRWVQFEILFGEGAIVPGLKYLAHKRIRLKEGEKVYLREGGSIMQSRCTCLGLIKIMV